MTRFSKLTMVDGVPTESNIREIPQSAIQACPHCILDADHYRADNTCRCDDPHHEEMWHWGYTWNPDKERWT